MVRVQNGDDGFRSVALVLAVLGALAVLSFVMAGVVGAREKSEVTHSASIAAPVSTPR